MMASFPCGRRSAIAAVPAALVQDVALIGPWAKIVDEPAL
jgi:hypothetical protein